MKNLWLLIFFPILGISQNKNAATIKVHEGVMLHDEGKYDEALIRYNEALVLDKDNLIALSEKAMTLEAAKKYDEAVELSKHVINIYPNEDIKNIFVTYANSLDHQKKSDLAIKVYDQGLKKYPDYYQLHFNKGISLINSKQTEKALESFQNAVKLEPTHPGSWNALAVLNRDKRIPSIMASSRYLTLDNRSPRAKGNLDLLLDLMMQGVTQKDDQSINLNIDPSTVGLAGSKKKVANNFSVTDMVLSMSAAMDFDEKNKNKTAVQKFIDKFETICRSMDETKKGQKGFYWEFVGPYFIEIEKNKMTETFAYIIFLPKQTEDVLEYHKNNSQKIKEFYTWSDNYAWK